jgi:poly(hydroxyalkanoate) granule-associated protein
MATRKRTASSSATGTDAEASRLTDTIRESAQQIWLAGLGAFAKAQAEGGKVFEALVREGQAMQRRTQEVAEESAQEAVSRMGSLASEMGARAAGQWGRLETLFEERVATALRKLGMPTARDLAQLQARIDELAAQVQALGGQAPAHKPAAKARAATRQTVRRTAAKKAAGNGH